MALRFRDVARGDAFRVGGDMADVETLQFGVSAGVGDV